MKRFFSLFARRGRRQGKTGSAGISSLRFSAEEPADRSLSPEMTGFGRKGDFARSPDMLSDSPESAETSGGEETKAAFFRMMTALLQTRFPRETVFSRPESKGNVDETRWDGASFAPSFHAEVREDDIPFRHGGFTGEMPKEWEGSSQESLRLLFDRAEETKEILSRLNETADEIRKELTI